MRTEIRFSQWVTPRANPTAEKKRSPTPVEIEAYSRNDLYWMPSHLEMQAAAAKSNCDQREQDCQVQQGAKSQWRLPWLQGLSGAWILGRGSWMGSVTNARLAPQNTTSTPVPPPDFGFGAGVSQGSVPRFASIGPR